MCRSLEYLDLSQTELYTLAPLYYLKKLTYLDVSGSTNLVDGDFQVMLDPETTAPLQSLFMPDHDSVTNEIIVDSAIMFTTLKRLDLGYRPLNFAEIQRILNHLPNLRFLRSCFLDDDMSCPDFHNLRKEFWPALKCIITPYFL